MNADKTEELSAIIREIQDRVRSRHPAGQAGTLAVPLPDMMPVVHARDAAEAKVASIGSVNPRPPGLINNTIQAFKRTVARSLNFFVRDQVDFNRAAMGCVESLMTALGESNRVIAALAARIDEVQAEARAHGESLRAEAAELKDIRVHWVHWREEWQQKLAQNEIHFLRAASDLSAAYQHRLTLLEETLRGNDKSLHNDYLVALKTQNEEFTASMEKAIADVQQRLWADLERIRTEYERVIHNELRIVRQRAAVTAPVTSAPRPEPEGLQLDYTTFSQRFRGNRDYVLEKQKFYLPVFAGKRNVLDVGCGRGEFLELMKEAGVTARGIDAGAESIAFCRSQGFDAEEADLFTYLSAVPPGSLDGLFSSQVVEHLPVHRLPEFVRLASQALMTGGVLAIETPNPECLAIFATHFYLDPTHTRPVPHQLLSFYCEEYGLGSIKVHTLSPAMETMPEVAELPAGFRDRFFGGLDYALVAIKL